MMSYCQDANTLLDGFRLLHKVGDPGHDGRAVVAGPVTEEALHLLKTSLVKNLQCWRCNSNDNIHLAKTKALTGVASSDESRIEAVGHVSPPLNESLKIT